jgi:hypothetical protein
MRSLRSLLRRRPAAIPQRRQREHASATGRGQCPWCVAAAPTRSPALLLAQLRDAARYARGVRWAVHPALGGEACWRGEHECLDVPGVGTELAPPRTERVHVLSAIVRVRAHAARAVSRSTCCARSLFTFSSRLVLWFGPCFSCVPVVHRTRRVPPHRPDTSASRGSCTCVCDCVRAVTSRRV